MDLNDLETVNQLSELNEMNWGTERSLPALNSPTTVQLRSQNRISPEDLERIKPRTMELLELATSWITAQKLPMAQAMLLKSMLPVLPLTMSNLETATLQKWLNCLNEIVTAVLDLDCSQPEYEARVEEALKGLQ